MCSISWVRSPILRERSPVSRLGLLVGLLEEKTQRRPRLETSLASSMISETITKSDCQFRDQESFGPFSKESDRKSDGRSDGRSDVKGYGKSFRWPTNGWRIWRENWKETQSIRICQHAVRLPVEVCDWSILIRRFRDLLSCLLL